MPPDPKKSQIWIISPVNYDISYMPKPTDIPIKPRPKPPNQQLDGLVIIILNKNAPLLAEHFLFLNHYFSGLSGGGGGGGGVVSSVFLGEPSFFFFIRITAATTITITTIIKT